MPDNDLKSQVISSLARQSLRPFIDLVWGLGSLLSTSSPLAQTVTGSVSSPAAPQNSITTVATSTISVNGGEKIEIKAHTQIR